LHHKACAFLKISVSYLLSTNILFIFKFTVAFSVYFLLLLISACISLFFLSFSSSLCQVFESVNYVLPPIIFPLYLFQTTCSYSFLFLPISSILPLYLLICLLCSFIFSESSSIFSVTDLQLLPLRFDPSPHHIYFLFNSQAVSCKKVGKWFQGKQNSFCKFCSTQCIIKYLLLILTALYLPFCDANLTSHLLMSSDPGLSFPINCAWHLLTHRDVIFLHTYITPSVNSETSFTSNLFAIVIWQLEERKLI